MREVVKKIYFVITIPIMLILYVSFVRRHFSEHTASAILSGTILLIAFIYVFVIAQEEVSGFPFVDTNRYYRIFPKQPSRRFEVFFKKPVCLKYSKKNSEYVFPKKNFYKYFCAAISEIIFFIDPDYSEIKFESQGPVTLDETCAHKLNALNISSVDMHNLKAFGAYSLFAIQEMLQGTYRLYPPLPENLLSDKLPFKKYIFVANRVNPHNDRPGDAIYEFYIYTEKKLPKGIDTLPDGYIVYLKCEQEIFSILTADEFYRLRNNSKKLGGF